LMYRNIYFIQNWMKYVKNKFLFYVLKEVITRINKRKQPPNSTRKTVCRISDFCLSIPKQPTESHCRGKSPNIRSKTCHPRNSSPQPSGLQAGILPLSCPPSYYHLLTKEKLKKIQKGPKNCDKFGQFLSLKHIKITTKKR